MSHCVSKPNATGINLCETFQSIHAAVMAHGECVKDVHAKNEGDVKEARRLDRIIATVQEDGSKILGWQTAKHTFDRIANLSACQIFAPHAPWTENDVAFDLDRFRVLVQGRVGKPALECAAS